MSKKEKAPLILLHGALGMQKQFDFLMPELKEYFEVHRLNFEGHGEAGPTDHPFSMSRFAESVLGYMDEHDIRAANFFGYSLGGYVALVLAKNHPERVAKVATLGTILQWNEKVAERECGYLHPAKIKEKVPHFAEQLKKRHGSGWEQLVDNTRDMLQYLGKQPAIQSDEWKQMDCLLRIHLGDRDTTAGLAETIAIYKEMEKAELTVLPKTGHPIHEVDKELLLVSLEKFFTKEKKNGSRM